MGAPVTTVQYIKIVTTPTCLHALASDIKYVHPVKILKCMDYFCISPVSDFPTNKTTHIFRSLGTHDHSCLLII